MALKGRGGMQWAPGKEGTLGFWPENLDQNTGWTGKSFSAYRETLNIGQRYHQQNHALDVAAKAGKPPPELPDVQARNQLARADLKRLEVLRDQMVAIDKQVTEKQMALRPFEYEGPLSDSLLRQEMRSFLCGLNEEQRRAKMREYEWRRAALETQPELSGLSEVQAKAIRDETLQLRYPNELAGIRGAQEAIQAVSTAFETVRKAVDHELKVTTGTVSGPAPEEGEPWI